MAASKAKPGQHRLQDEEILQIMVLASCFDLMSRVGVGCTSAERMHPTASEMGHDFVYGGNTVRYGGRHPLQQVYFDYSMICP